MVDLFLTTPSSKGKKNESIPVRIINRGRQRGKRTKFDVPSGSPPVLVDAIFRQWKQIIPVRIICRRQRAQKKKTLFRDSVRKIALFLMMRFSGNSSSSRRNGSCGDHRPQWKQMIPVRFIISSMCGFRQIIFCCLHELFLCNNTLVFFVVSCKFWFSGKIELLSQSRFLESMR